MKQYRIVKVTYTVGTIVYFVEERTGEEEWRTVRDISSLAAIMSERPRAFTLSTATTYIKNEKLADSRVQIKTREVVG